MRKGNYITTYTGIKFYPLDPREEEVNIRDISHALSLLSRANGHYRHFLSVGEHSLNCAEEAKQRGYSKRVQLACLLHDASEAYISDVTRPLKKELKIYLKIEEKLQGFIYAIYGLTDLTTEELRLVDTIDDEMLVHEMKVLLNVNKPSQEKLLGHYSLEFRSMEIVEKEFSELTRELLKELNLQTV